MTQFAVKGRIISPILVNICQPKLRRAWDVALDRGELTARTAAVNRCVRDHSIHHSLTCVQRADEGCRSIPLHSKTSSCSYVSLHHEMNRNVPDGHFHVLILSESKFYAIYNGENHFQIRGLVAELHVFKYHSMTFDTFRKTCFKCWRVLC